VTAVRDEVLKKRFFCKRFSFVGDQHGCPVGLAGHETIGFEEVGVEGFFNMLASLFEERGGNVVDIRFDIEIVYASSFERGEGGLFLDIDEADLDLTF